MLRCDIDKHDLIKRLRLKDWTRGNMQREKNVKGTLIWGKGRRYPMFLVRACVSYLEYVLRNYFEIDFLKLGLVSDNRF